ncbi:hypothetical protein BMG523Draft_03606, partial [Frankia sp. BMG5.23]
VMPAWAMARCLRRTRLEVSRDCRALRVTTIRQAGTGRPGAGRSGRPRSGSVRRTGSRAGSRVTRVPGCPGDPAPDRRLRADEPTGCSSCEAGLAGGQVLADMWTQVRDVPEPRVETTEWALPRRRCGCCGKITAARVPDVPWATAGSVCYGPLIGGAVVLLGNEGNVPLARTALVLNGMYGTAVSTGFVARTLQRAAEALAARGYDEKMKAALRAEPVLCGDESLVNVLRRDLDEATGRPTEGAPHLLALRTPWPGLV